MYLVNKEADTSNGKLIALSCTRSPALGSHILMPFFGTENLLLLVCMGFCITHRPVILLIHGQ